jgi:hypothetical protein
MELHEEDAEVILTVVVEVEMLIGGFFQIHPLILDVEEPRVVF